jgi:hypothetical protein
MSAHPDPLTDVVDAADDPLLPELYNRYHYPRQREFYSLLHRDGYPYTLRDVAAFLRKRSANERYTPYRRPFKYFPIKYTSSRPFERIQVDLMDMRNYNGNQHRRFGFVMVDAFSRFAIVIPISSKSLGECGRALKDCLDEIHGKTGTYPKLIDCDSESAFNRNSKDPGSFGAQCRAHGIEIRQALFRDPGTGTVPKAHDVRTLAYVDRFIRTLRDHFNKYYHTDGNRSKTWYSESDAMVNQYNNVKHTSLKMTPNEAVNQPGEQLPIREATILKNAQIAAQQPWAQVELKDGDLVRVLLNRSAFDKGTEARWSDVIYPITEIKDGVYFHVNGKLYRKYELLKTSQESNPRVHDQDLADAARAQNARVAKRLRQEGLDIEPRVTRLRRNNPDGLVPDNPRANELTSRRTRARAEISHTNVLPSARSRRNG